MAKARSTPTAPDAPLALNAALPIAARLDECLACAAKIHGPEDVAELHELRIAFKRLRYTVEVFAGAIEGAKGYLDTMKRFQDFLGEIHDADVLAPLLAREIEASETDRPGLHALHERTLADRAELYEGFTSAWAEALAAGFPDRLRAAAFYAAIGGGEHQTPEARELIVQLELASAVEDVPAKAARRARKDLAHLSAVLHDGDAEAVRAAVCQASKSLRKILEGDPA